MQSGSMVELVNVSKSFSGELVLDNISLNIKNSEFLTLLGPSGCGKTTTLRIIGGFETPSAGDVYFEGARITYLPPYKRKVNTVFQKYALFPFLNVAENIAFGLKIKKMAKKDIAREVRDMLELVGLRGFEKRDVSSLSGGQQQRVAIARALVNRPRVLLLDEPLGALDLKMRKEMQTELKNIQQRLSITFVYVTHDQEEALTMSDTIIVMNEGKIQQVGTPQDIYNEPKNPFVADFIGESNIIPAVMPEDYVVEFAGTRFECLDRGFDENETVDAVIRPEDIEVVPPEQGQYCGVVQSITFKGVHYEIIVDQNGYKWMIHSILPAEKGSEIGMVLTPDDIHIMKRAVEED